MSYTTGGLFEYVIKQGADLNSLADVGTYSPGLSPVIVRGVAAIIDNDIGATGQIKFDKRVTFGSDSGRGDGDVGALNLTTAHTQGKVVYKMGLNVKISPGETVVAEVTDVTASGDKADIILLLEPVSEVPSNMTKLVVST